jgi:hypothetical protein
MTDVSVSQEDRERLARIKFQEWLTEGVKDPAVIEHVKGLFNEWIAELRQQPQQPQQKGDGQPQPPQQEQPKQRKRNLLDVCLTDTFGF